MSERESTEMCCRDGDDCQCRPLGFLFGLPFASLSLILSLIGVVIFIVVYLPFAVIWGVAFSNIERSSARITSSYLCPCCVCMTAIVAFATTLIKSPFAVMKWFVEHIPF